MGRERKERKIFFAFEKLSKWWCHASVQSCCKSWIVNVCGACLRLRRCVILHQQHLQFCFSSAWLLFSMYCSTIWEICENMTSQKMVTTIFLCAELKKKMWFGITVCFLILPNHLRLWSSSLPPVTTSTADIKSNAMWRMCTLLPSCGSDK